jgi:hypothetical protein
MMALLGKLVRHHGLAERALIFLKYERQQCGHFLDFFLD